MNFRKSLLEIAKRVMAQYPDDVPKGSEVALEQARKLPDFEHYVTTLLLNVMQDLLYDARSESNRAKRKTLSRPKPKVVSGASKSVQEAAEFGYLYFIGGLTLGNVMGEQFMVIAESEERIGYSHLFNSRLCKRLAALVPKGKRLHEVLSESRLQAIARDVHDSMYRDGTEAA